tara:strand:+ start:1268 stop:1567 length:300 start_codon:yes stop_codon:yes gene_type:complete
MKEGFYYDPFHGGCLRKIKRSNTDDSFLITGAYGDDEPETGKKWTATAKKIGKNVYCVSFSGKKHVNHGDYKAVWNEKSRELNWQDGNKWKLLFDWYKL